MADIKAVVTALHKKTKTVCEDPGVIAEASGRVIRSDRRPNTPLYESAVGLLPASVK
jgi:hypothetical protein